MMGASDYRLRMAGKMKGAVMRCQGWGGGRYRVCAAELSG